MSKISTMFIPRCIYPDDFRPAHSEIHTFADASQSGYGACTYVRSVSSDNRIRCSLLLGNQESLS